MNIEIGCTINRIELENDNGHMVDSVQATCNDCGHETQSFGTEPVSVRRCLVMMREECSNPGKHSHFYVAENDEDRDWP